MEVMYLGKVYILLAMEILNLSSIYLLNYLIQFQLSRSSWLDPWEASQLSRLRLFTKDWDSSEQFYRQLPFYISLYYLSGICILSIINYLHLLIQIKSYQSLYTTITLNHRYKDNRRHQIITTDGCQGGRREKVFGRGGKWWLFCGVTMEEILLCSIWIIYHYNSMDINSNNRINLQPIPNPIPNQQIQPAIPANPPPIRNRPRRTFLQNLARQLRASVSLQKITYIQQHKILLLAGKTAVSHPQQQNFFDVLKAELCPSLSLYSLTTLIILANTILFVVSIFLGFDVGGSVLETNSDTLLLLGMNNSLRVCQGEVYRLFAAQYLHVNLLHFLTNTLIILIIIPKFQYSFGPFRTYAIYLLSAISGNIISDLLLTQDLVKAGASTSLYGMVGMSIGYTIINWQAFSNIGFIYKFKIIISIILITLFLILFIDVVRDIDYIGHIAAFITGIFLSFIPPTINSNRRQTVLRVIFGVIWVSSVIISFLGFYFIRKDFYCKTE